MNLSLRPLFSSPLRCAWCHDDLAASTWRCPACAAAAHADCALEGCPTLGCRARARLVLLLPAPVRRLARRAALRRRFRALCAAPSAGLLVGGAAGLALGHEWLAPHAAAGGLLATLVVALATLVDRAISARDDEGAFAWVLRPAAVAALCAATGVVLLEEGPATAVFIYCIFDPVVAPPPPSFCGAFTTFAPSVIGVAAVASLAFAAASRLAWSTLGAHHEHQHDVSGVRWVFAVGLTVGLGLLTIALAEGQAVAPHITGSIF